MSYRDDTDAAMARADAAVREAKLLAGENERLAAELARAQEWLGGARKRAILAAVIVAVVVAAGAGGFAIARFTAAPSPGQTPPPPVVPLPQVFGVIVADGPQLGRWSLKASRCSPRAGGVELNLVGSEDHNVWLTENVVEIETPTADLVLDKDKCAKMLDHALVQQPRVTPALFDGFVDLDCSFAGNHLFGRIDFKNCR